MSTGTFSSGLITRNPAWVQLLGLCPLLAVSSSVTNAVGLSLATAFVLCGSNTLISASRRIIPDFARLPLFVLIIAAFTTIAVMVLEAYAYDLYQRIALFVQIIVTNCMILGRAEAFASTQPVGRAVLDALGTSLGFAIALIGLGAAREIIGQGTLLADMEQLFGPAAASLEIHLLPDTHALIITRLPPGAFLVAGLLLAIMQAVRNRQGSEKGSREGPGA